jgi:hypothetical protein
MNKKIFTAILACFIGLYACSTDDHTSSASVSSSSSGDIGGMNDVSSSSSSSSSSNSSSSSSSGQGGFGGNLNQGGGGEGGSILMNGDPCYFNNYEGIFEFDHCLLCGPGNHLNQILKGYPLDPDSCFQYVCQSDPGNPYYAFPSKNVKEANTPCVYSPDIQPIHNATCTEDGQCCYQDINIGDVCSPVPEYP